MILVTGGTGLVGAHLLYHLSLENDVVTAIHRENSNLQAVKKVFSYYTKDFEHLFNKIKWIEADITDICQLEIAFENITEVYHSAALVSFNPKDYKAMRKINIEGTTNIVNFCINKKVQKLCFVSSIATIEKSINNKVIDEEGEWNVEKNNYGYAITKYGAEMEVWRASQEGIDVVIVNPGVILGAGFWNAGSGKIFTKIFHGLEFYTEGKTGFVGVKDVVKTMVFLTNSTIKNERFILVSENKSYKEVFFLIADALKKKRPYKRIHRWKMELLWRGSSFLSIITGKEPLLSKYAAKSANSTSLYTSKKVQEILPFKFQTIEAVVKEVSENYPTTLS